MMFDETVHEFFEGLDRVRWREIEESRLPNGEYAFEWYYAEDRLYVIRHRKTGFCCLVKAGSPTAAYEKIQKRFLD